MADAATHAAITAPMIMAGISMLVGTSSGIALRFGTQLQRSAWKGILGRRKYEILFGTLMGETQEDQRVQIRRILRWIGFLPSVRESCRELLRYNMKEADGSITKLRLPLEPFTFELDGIEIWAAMIRNPQGLIEGFEFWTRRWGCFTSEERHSMQVKMMDSIDAIVDGITTHTTPLPTLLDYKSPKTLSANEIDFAFRIMAKGDGDVANDLGCLYHRGGKGIPKDDTKAHDLYKTAWKRGCMSGAFNLAEIYMKRGDYQVATEYLMMMIRAGVVKGAWKVYSMLATCYAKDPKEHKGQVAALRAKSKALRLEEEGVAPSPPSSRSTPFSL